MKVIGRSVGGALLVEIDKQEEGLFVRIGEALVDGAALVVAAVPPSPPATAAQPKRVYAKRAAKPAFPGGPVPKPVLESVRKYAKQAASVRPISTSGRASTVTTKDRPCEQCKMPYVPTGNAQKLCPACKQARLDEIKRIAREQQED